MKTLCLNITYEPLGFLPPERAVQIYLQDRVEIIEDSGKTYRSSSGVEVPAPEVIRLKRFIKMPRDVRECITPRVLFARDNFMCQYCEIAQADLKGKNNRLTIDHVHPKSKGGPHHWENVVTACYRCNLKKRDRNPTDANMPLKGRYKDRSPKKPSLLTTQWGGRVSPKQAKWITSYYGKEALE